MPRIAGVDLPKEKRIEFALTYIHGIGKSKSREILTKSKVNFDKRAKDLAEDETARIRSLVEGEKVEGDLRRETQMAIKRLMDLGCWRGLRHRKNLPSRGQRTRTNARTRKGPRRAPVTGKKAPTKK